MQPPHEILFKIFSHLVLETADLSALGRMALVCTAWRDACLSTNNFNPYFALYQRQFTVRKDWKDGTVGLLFYKERYLELQAFNDVNQRLVCAAWRGYERLLPSLLAAATDVNHAFMCIEPGAQTPEATESQVDVVRTFGFNMDGRPHTPLTAAIRGIHMACIDLLLQHQEIDCTRPNLKNGVTPLVYAFALSIGSDDGRFQEIIAKLLPKTLSSEFGAAVWGECYRQKLPLKNISCFQWLPQLKKLNPQVDLYTIDSHGNTILHFACRRGLMRIVGALLARGDLAPFQKNCAQKTALEYLLEHVKMTEAAAIKCIKAFLNHRNSQAVDIWHCLESYPKLLSPTPSWAEDLLVDKVLASETDEISTPSPTKKKRIYE